ncbi:MAG: hypothetical protein RLZZ517_326 [Candidatus Parcubacteria bacterium]|jgi:hypothetical protein
MADPDRQQGIQNQKRLIGRLIDLVLDDPRFEKFEEEKRILREYQEGIRTIGPAIQAARTLSRFLQKESSEEESAD